MPGTQAGRTGRRPGEVRTRTEILAAAQASFASNGYAGTTIRGIAAAAGVDPALVHYFFRDKERLFAAAMDVPLEPSEMAAATLAGDRAGLGERLARQFVRTWEDPRTGPAMQAVLRGAASHPRSAVLIGEFFGRELLGRIAASLDLRDPELRAGMAASQLVGLAMLRYVLRVEPVAGADPETLVRWLAPTLQRYLTGADPSPAELESAPDERSVASRPGDTVGQAR
jgi:AcrR family transcriptional regulator